MGLGQLAPLSTHIIEVDGIRASYVRVGRGQPVVLLHGWGGSAASFGPIPALLADRCDVVAIDLPGFGATPRPPVPWGTFEYAAFVASFLRQGGLAPCTLIGHSFGGRVSLAVAAQEPALVTRLVLVDSAGIVPRRGPRYYLRVYSVKALRAALSLPGLAGVRAAVMDRLYRRVGSADFNAATDPILRATLVRVVNEDLRHLMPSIKAPTLLIWGDQDQDTPLSDARLMERLIPDAGLVVFEGAGHFSYLDRLDQFCRVVAHFIEHG
ncbi:MAG TPA: alpha/beta hydrolase [Chloroflexota bacterium]|nr:alpha/beta hydrolase [Chloroflexota bacterium]